MIIEKQKRRKRFERDNSVSLILTGRDKKIIKWVFEHRFLTSEQIIALAGGNRQVILRRLYLLFHAGFLDRPRAQQTVFGNNSAMVYGIGNKGADFLAQELDLPLASIDWASKNREVKSIFFLEHTLMVAQFLTVMRLACRQVKGIEFIEPEKIIARRPILAAEKNNPLSWRVEGKAKGKKFSFFIVPDSGFGLQSNKVGETYYFLETDRSSMPVKRHNFMKSSIYKKMFGYINSWNQKLFTKNFGFKKVRILITAISDKRIASMIKLNQQLDPKGKGYGLFLFARDKDLNLENPNNVFDKKWINGRGETVSIID